MDSKHILGLLVAIVIGVIMVGSLLAPTIDTYSDKELTVENTGMPYTEAGGDHTIILTTDGITYDGEAVDMTQFPGSFNTYTLVYGQESFVRWGITNALTASDADGLRTFNITAGNTITIVLTETTVTVTTTASSQSFTADDVLYHISPTGGDYVLALNPYVSDDDEVYAAGDTYFTGTGRPAPIRLWIVWTGELEEITVNANGFNGSGYTAVAITDTTVNIDNVKSNLYRYDSVVFNYTATATVEDVSTDYPLTSTYTYFLAPAEVSYDNPAYLGSEYEGLLGAIVVIAIAGLLLLIVGAVVRRRN